MCSWSWWVKTSEGAEDNSVIYKVHVLEAGLRRAEDSPFTGRIVTQVLNSVFKFLREVSSCFG